MMGTRCGSIDPSIIEYVCKESGKDVSEITNDLNKKSGLLGICGFNDNRDVEKAIAAGDERAKLALDMYVDIIDRFIAEYYIELDGKVDAMVMTAGVLENGSETREAILSKLKPFGIEVDKKANDSIAGWKDVHEGLITTKQSKIPVYVIPTNEEIMIIRDTYKLTNK
jgi:acetate kinase